AAGKKAIEHGVNSGVIVKEMCKVVGGGGGGRADMAQGGGPDVKKIEEALKRGVEVVNQIISRS
ncbi:MAG: alanyl-tRNA synthetase, partial [Candidatus Methanomarinus sp.]